MRIKEEIKVVEQKVVNYVAEDGTKFLIEKDCKRYEAEQLHKKFIELAEKLRIKELDESLPLSNDGLVNDNNTFRWYRLENKNDFETVNNAYDNTLTEPKVYPEIICVETCGYKAYMDDAYSYDMTTCKEITKNFWKRLGYQVTIEQIK